MPFDPTDPKYASPLASMAQDRMIGMLNQPQMKVFADTPQDQGTKSGSPILPGQMQLNRVMGMAKGGSVNDELAGIKDTIRAEFAARGLDFDRFVSNPAVMDEVGKSIAAQGQSGDTILAHINPKEADALKRMGGSGTINPATGLPQFADDSASSNESPSYSGGDYSGYTGGSDLGGYSGSGNTSYNPSTGGTNTSPDMGGYTSSGSGGRDYSPSSSYASNFNPIQTSVSPMGINNDTISIGTPEPSVVQAVNQAINNQPSFANFDPMSGAPIGGASNFSGLGYVATAPEAAQGLTTFDTTMGGINSNPLDGVDAGLSNIAFESPANLPSEVAVDASGNIGPNVVGYDPTNRAFIDANGNQFVVGPTGQRQYTAFSTTAPTPGQSIASAPGIQTEIMAPLQGAAIMPEGMFSKSGYPVMQPSPSMVVKEQGRVPTPIEQAAAQTNTPMSSAVTALSYGNPAEKMDAAMQILGGGANMFNTSGDVFTTAQTTLPDATILDRRLAGMEKIGTAPQLAGADLTGTVVPDSQTLANFMGTEPQGNYLFSAATPGQQLGPEQYKLTGLEQAYEKWSKENPIRAAALNLPLGGGVETFNMNIPGMVKEKPYGEAVEYNPTAKTFTVTDPKSPELAELRQDPSLSQYLTDITKRTAPITNWGEPGAGEVPSVYSDVGPTTFAGLTPLAQPAPAQIEMPRDSSPTMTMAQDPQLSSWESALNSLPSIVGTANAATPSLFSPEMETTFQMPGTIPLPPTRPEEAPLFSGNIPIPTPRPEALDAAIAQAPVPVKAAIKAATGTSTNPPANTEQPQTAYDIAVAKLEDADMIANGMSKEEYAAAMGVPVEQVKTRITTQFGPPMAEYYTKTVLEALAGMTGENSNMAGAANLISMLSPLGVLGIAAKAGYNKYKKKGEKKANGGYVSPLSSMRKN